MGLIYAAEDIRLRRRVAIKFLPLELSQDSQAVERFQREARAASALNHPHICTLYDIGSTIDNGRVQHFIVMELLEGQNLRQLIGGKPLPLDDAILLGEQIADALDAAHSGGIIHRDIKPANIFVTRRGDAKVLDFGLAKLTSHSAKAEQTDVPTFAGPADDLITNPGTALGTIAYMSPEQALGHPVDARSDLFSFGSVLYEMNTGRQAFAGRTLAAIFDAILHHDPVGVARLNSGVPPELDRIISKLLQKDPAARYQTAAEVRDECRVLLQATGGTRARPAAVSRPFRRRSALGAAAAGLALTGIAGFLYLSPRGDPAPGIGIGGRPAVAVVAFDNPASVGDIAWLTTGLPGMIETGLAQTPGLDVISNERLAEVVIQIGESALGALDENRVLDVARRAGAGALVSGSLFKTGSDVRVDIQVQDVVSGRLLGAFRVTGSDVFALADELTVFVRHGLNVKAEATPARIADVTTTSLEAYRLYNEGVEALTNLRRAEARRLFEQAIEIDTTFASAYFRLMTVTRQLGDAAASERYRERTIQHLRRLPERDRLSMQGQEARHRGDVKQAEALFEELIAKYPDAADGYNQLRSLQRDVLGDEQKALTTLERGVKAVPNSPFIRNIYGYTLLAAGRFPEAIRQFEEYIRLRPREPNSYDSLAEAYLASGQAERAIAVYTRALEVEPTFYPSNLGRSWAFAALGRYDEAIEDQSRHLTGLLGSSSPSATSDIAAAFMLSRVGQYRDAAQRITAGIAAAEGVDNFVSVAALRTVSGFIAIDRRQYGDALREAAALGVALRQIASVPVRADYAILRRLLTGVAHARAGRLDAARTERTLQKNEHQPRTDSQRWWDAALEGEVALAARDFAAAERAFASGEPPLKMFFNLNEVPRTLIANSLSLRDGAARVRIARGDLRGAADTYQRLLTTDIGSKWTAMLEPRYVLELARLLEQTGDRAAARAQYERFLELWKGADPGLPEVIEARAAVARL